MDEAERKFEPGFNGMVTPGGTTTPARVPFALPIFITDPELIAAGIVPLLVTFWYVNALVPETTFT